MNKKKIILITLSPIVLAGLILLILFLATIQVKHINFIDEKGDVFRHVTAVKSIYNKVIKAEDLLGYKFVSWDGELSEKEFNVDDYNKDEYNLFYETDALSMPVVKVTTQNGAKINSKEVYTPSTISVLNTDEKFLLDKQSAGIRLRGNSTVLASKKPYRIKFDSKTNLLGLNDGAKLKSWVLLAEHFDYSMTRNSLNFFIGSHLNFYCSDYKFVELYLNGEYQGVYLLCEQQQIDKHRINIEEYIEGETEELDTGYLLENDYYYYEQEDFYIENNVNGQVQDIYHWLVKSDTTKPEQLEYIQAFMQNIYNNIFGGATKEELENLIDINSAVDMTILQLFNADSDANSSFYVYRDKGGKLQFGAPWDADMAFGNLQHAKFLNGEIVVNHLLGKLMENDWFFELVKARWNELRPFQQEIIEYVENVSAAYEKEFQRNYEKNKTFGSKNFSAQADEVKDFKNQKDASKYLVDWLKTRFEKLNQHFA